MDADYISLRLQFDILKKFCADFSYEKYNGLVEKTCEFLPIMETFLGGESFDVSTDEKCRILIEMHGNTVDKWMLTSICASNDTLEMKIGKMISHISSRVDYFSRFKLDSKSRAFFIDFQLFYLQCLDLESSLGYSFL